MSMTDRAALVTGGGRGIGRAICLALARSGAKVCVNYSGSAQAAEETAEACRALGVEAFSHQANVTDAAACTAMVDAVIARFGRIDILVCNAGVTRDNLMVRLTEDDWDAVMDTNLKGAFHCMKAAYRPMMKQKYGRVVAISSVVGLHGNAGQANYAASKAGLIGLVKSMGKELGGRGVTCNAVAPGYIETDMTAALPEGARAAMLQGIPAARAGTAEEVAQAVAFLVGDESGYVTGQVLAVDGGMAV